MVKQDYAKRNSEKQARNRLTNKRSRNAKPE